MHALRAALATRPILLSAAVPAPQAATSAYFITSARPARGFPAPPNTHARKNMAANAGSNPPPSFETVDVKEAAARLAAGTPLLDVRGAGEFAGGHPPGAKNADVQGDGFLAAAAAAFPEKDEPLLVSCLKGGRSAAASAQLVAAGYTAITNVAGGWSAWTEAGLPEEK